MGYILGKGGQLLHYKCTEETTLMLPQPRGGKKKVTNMEEIQTFLPCSHHVSILICFHLIPSHGSTSHFERE